MTTSPPRQEDGLRRRWVITCPDCKASSQPIFGTKFEVLAQGARHGFRQVGERVDVLHCHKCARKRRTAKR